ncbi:MAG TPA: pyruvate ferredoxin oxidoreductase, partial [bacterium (Candidatus Stahlbacteria)]|nr:pyruvate ferredoxin oxidoreductase [Candidatus Stahlbacteria bacterium]
EVDEEFKTIFGRSYGLVEPYKCDDAKLILVTSGTITGTSRVVVDELRERGKKVGLLKIRTFRPFPVEDVRQVLVNADKVAVIDRNISFGHSGIFFEEVKSALYNGEKTPPIWGFIAGLGGRDVTPATVQEAITYTERHDEPEDIVWLGLKL